MRKKKNRKKKDFYNYYEQEVIRTARASSGQISLFELLFFLMKATGIFFVMTFIVFGLVNYEVIRAQLVDSRSDVVLPPEEHAIQTKKDSDGDGLPDWWEEENGLDDAKKDSDNDGITNLLEAQFGTDPTNPDTDNDGFFDGEEIRNGNNPKGFGRIDTDNDGVLDWWEDENGLDKNNPDDADKDFDQDGLSNKQEFIYNSDPKNKDTDGDGKGDGREVDEGLSPIEDGTLEAQLKKVDLNDKDQDGLSSEKELFFGTDPEKADTDGDTFNDYREISRGYDPLKPGIEFVEASVEIPSIGVNAPIIWSQSSEKGDLLSELENGLIHYPGTAFPGFIGNVYITGHSSYYSWSKSGYKDVLKDLEKLKIGDEVIFNLKLGGTYSKKIIYEISADHEVVAPSSRKLFMGSKEHDLLLVTCWPLGTNWKRMIVKGKMKDPVFEY